MRNTKSGVKPAGSAMYPKRSSAGGCLSAGFNHTATMATGGAALGSWTLERIHCGPIADPLRTHCMRTFALATHCYQELYSVGRGSTDPSDPSALLLRIHACARHIRLTRVRMA